MSPVIAILSLRCISGEGSVCLLRLLITQLFVV